MQLRKNEVFHKSLNNEYHVGSSVEICELWLMFWFENDWYFCNITKSGWFWKRLSRKKVLNNHSLKSL